MDHGWADSPRKMRQFLLVVLMVLGLAGRLGWAASPSAEEIGRIRAMIGELAKDGDSLEIDTLVKEELAKIIAEYGIEGIAFVALSEPMLMEALLASPSFGYETVANVVVEMASSTAELEQMLVSVMTAQLNIGGEVDETVTQEIILSSSKNSSLSLESKDVGELVTSVNRLATTVRSGANGIKDVSIVESQNPTERLAEIVKETYIEARPDDRIISPVR